MRIAIHNLIIMNQDRARQLVVLVGFCSLARPPRPTHHRRQMLERSTSEMQLQRAMVEGSAIKFVQHRVPAHNTPSLQNQTFAGAGGACMCGRRRAICCTYSLEVDCELLFRCLICLRGPHADHLPVGLHMDGSCSGAVAKPAASHSPPISFKPPMLSPMLPRSSLDHLLRTRFGARSGRRRTPAAASG